MSAGRKKPAFRQWRVAVAALMLALLALPSRAEPLLSYVTETEGRVQWRISDAATARDGLFLELPRAPEHSFWDPATRTVTYVAGGGSFRARYDDSPGRPERLGPAPDAPGEIVALWRAATDGRLQAVKVHRVPETEVIETAETITYRLPDGRLIPGIRDDKWRSFVVCTRQAMTAAGSWSTEKQIADGWSYEGEPCVRLDLSKRREAGVSQFALHESYRCARTIGQSAERSTSTLCRHGVPKARLRTFRSKALSGANFDFVSTLATGRTHDVAYGCVIGHATHIYDQIFLVAPGEDGIKPLALDVKGQLQIGLMRGFLLVARSVDVVEEGHGFDPHVIDLDSGEVVFRARGRDALWVPE